ncbi:MAG: tetratricopeptide repeat protein, partial [Nannocystaceae bacterium]|nr:tetratricopeptide repeat protein [Nannocystaceae bacterium]
AAAAAVAVGGGVLAVRAQPSPCAALHDDDRGPWAADERAALAAHIAASSQHDAAALAARVDAALADYGVAWTRMRTEACEAHRVHGEQSASLFDQRLAGLERRRAAAAGPSEVVREADADAVPLFELVPAVRGLPRIDDCADAEALAAVVPLPGDDEARAAIAAATASLERAWSRRYLFWEREPLLAPVTAIAEVARAHDYPPLEAKALSLLSDLHDDAGEYEEAAQALHQGLRAAAAAHDDRTAALLAIKLVAVLSLGQRQYAQAETAARLAEALLVRADSPEQDWGGLRSAQAMVARLQGHHSEAVALHREALARIDADPNATAGERAGERNNFAGTLMHMGRHAEAAVLIDEALALVRPELGERHPVVASMLQTQGANASEAGELSTAYAAAERAHAIHAELLGPRSLIAGDSLDNLAVIERGMGRLAIAQAHAREAVAILEAALGPDHAEVGDAIWNLALVEADLGECAASAAHLRKALAIATAVGGAQGPDVAQIREHMALPCPPPPGDTSARDGSPGSVSDPQEP